MIKRAQIQGFKCLRDVTVDLGPFNVLIGPNDTGKSSFLQALSEPARWARGEPSRLLSTTTMGRGKSGLILVLDDGAFLQASLDESRKSFDLRIESRGEIIRESIARGASTVLDRLKGNAHLTPFGASDPVILDPLQIASPSPRGSGAAVELIASRGLGTAAHLARFALGDRVRFEAVQTAMQSATAGRIREVVVQDDTPGAYSLAFRLYDGTIVPARDISSGLLTYLGFLALIHREDLPKVLLIEEIENGLPPPRVHEIANILRNLGASGVQVIVTTHSPELLTACKGDEVLIFRRPEASSGTDIQHMTAPPSSESRRMPASGRTPISNRTQASGHAPASGHVPPSGRTPSSE
jgi:predicted ATPase